MKRILFFETSEFTGATRITRTFAKKLRAHFEERSVAIKDIENPTQEINDAISKHRPDILFCSFSRINSEVIKKGKNLGLVVVVRQDYKLADLSSAIKIKLIETYPKADWIIVQTVEMKEEMLATIAGLQSKNIKVIENPLDVMEIEKKAQAPTPFPNNGKFHYLWVGRKDPIKDLATLKKAFVMVNQKYPSTDLTLVFPSLQLAAVNSLRIS